MAHRHVTDKDGKSKYVHSSHGDVPHPEAHAGHAVAKEGQSERNMPHGHAAHPAPMTGVMSKDADGDYHSGCDQDEDDK